MEDDLQWMTPLVEDDLRCILACCLVRFVAFFHGNLLISTCYDLKSLAWFFGCFLVSNTNPTLALPPAEPYLVVANLAPSSVILANTRT